MNKDNFIAVGGTLVILLMNIIKFFQEWDLLFFFNSVLLGILILGLMSEESNKKEG